jgi:hypothetical protein
LESEEATRVRTVLNVFGFGSLVVRAILKASK